MKLTIPDDVLEAYHAIAERQGRPVEDVIAVQLGRFAAHPPGAARCYVFSGELLARLEAAVGHGPTRSEKDLCAKAEALAALSFGHIRLDFTYGQLAQIDHYAKRQGKSARDICTDIIRQMESQFFQHLGGPSGRPATPTAAAASREKPKPVKATLPVRPAPGAPHAAP